MDANLSKILNKLNIVFQKFTINQIIYLVFGVFVFIGAIMYFQFVSPKLNKIKQLKREYKDTNSQLNSKKDKLKMLYSVKEKYESQNTKYESENKNIVNTPDNSNESPIFLADMTSCFEDANNDVLSLQPLPKRAVNLPEGMPKANFVLEEYPMDIKAKGTYDSIIDGFKNIENYERLTKIQSFSLKGKKEIYPYLEASFAINVIPMMTKNLMEVVLSEEKLPENFGRDDPFKPLFLEPTPKSSQKNSGVFYLVGVLEEKKEKLALIEEGTNGYVVRKGDKIKGEYFVKEIMSDKVILLRKDKEMVLKLTGEQ